MFKGISYKKKFYAVIVLFIVLSIAAYKRSFKGAIEAVTFYIESKNNIDENINIDSKIVKLNIKNQSLDNIIGKKIRNPEAVQNEVLNFLSQKEEDFLLSKIENIHISSDNYFTIYSNIVTIEGSFNDLLKVIYSFEEGFEFARIASLKIYVLKNRRNSKNKLYTTIIFQNYEKKH